MFGLLLLGLIGLVAGLADGGSSDSSDNYDYRDYDYGDSYSSSSDTEERFENRWPYEYDRETGYSRSCFGNGNWTDNVGNEYEQKIDCWGNEYYEKIEDD